jgi:aspartyl-tRNA(Asn)/glutamyl-tRNA(Gln) amidotransferase subunit C
MTIDEATLDHLARLARLRIDPAERARLAGDLDALAGLVGRLAAVPTGGVAPLAHPGDLVLVPVADAVSEPDRSDELLALSGAAQGGYYTVPKVIE